MRALMFLLLGLIGGGMMFFGVLSSTTWIMAGFVIAVVFFVEFVHELTDTLA
ncbi:hypothetical protein KC976_03705 [Candidatus Saccharibacteria bacterium]|nr:hypothetical protein [Candidatus Saccharibacteria bacterium]